MTTKKVGDKKTAGLLRDLAQSYERFGGGFTCCAVERLCGRAVRAGYADVFLFDRFGGGNEQELWDSDDYRNIRILCLCFAAAMAETGDL